MGDTNRHYRQFNVLRRNGELYQTHELGPIAKYLNRGNRMVSLVSMASKAAVLKARLREKRPNDPLVNEQINQGDVVKWIKRGAPVPGPYSPDAIGE